MKGLGAVILITVLSGVGLGFSTERDQHGRSTGEVWGMPIVAVGSSLDESPDDLAVGPGVVWLSLAGGTGLLTLGIGFGFVSIGLYNFGLLFGFGQIGVGALAIGQVAVGPNASIGQLSIGSLALGQLGIGLFAKGQGALGYSADAPLRDLHEELDRAILGSRSGQ